MAYAMICHGLDHGGMDNGQCHGKPWPEASDSLIYYAPHRGMPGQMPWHAMANGICHGMPRRAYAMACAMACPAMA